MKLRATRKEMKQGYNKIISIGYCDAQHLLYWESPVAYSAGTYGWCCDYYVVNDVLISTGYSPIDSKNAIYDYNLVREYDKKANELNNKEEITALLYEFVDKCVQGKELVNN